jgi:iron(II)-dependent oxidoreductase
VAEATQPSAAAPADAVVAVLAETRQRTLQLVDGLTSAQLERVHSPLMSPLVWDLAHIGAFEDLWLVHRAGGRPLLLSEELMNLYDAFETPRGERGMLPLLRHAETLDYLERVRERTLAVIDDGALGDGLLHELVIRHEQQHGETMLQTLALARLPDYRLSCARRSGLHDGLAAASPGGSPTGLELIEVPPGPCTIGAPATGFAYDNERPRHRTDVRGYLIARTPVTNATYLTFVEGGGYERREWWTDEGWAWKEEYDITRPGAWTDTLDGEWRLGGLEPLQPDRPVVHVSWFEADAFARAHGARLPSELEWEKAATWDQGRGQALSYPWGQAPTEPGLHANVDQTAPGPLPPQAHPAGASPCGCLGMIGDVWEWTGSRFDGYPGFRAYPYHEYSEVFFGDAYRVLRGGSWATRARVATASFRNWDFPQRRQIFAGIRLARDL